MSQPPDRRSTRAVALIAALVGMLSLLLVAGPGEALGVHIRCHEVIVEDTTLDSDLIDCARPGLFIGADNVTLDLGGHTLDGAPHPPLFSTGIDNRAGHDGVTIKNGTIRDFSYGVTMEGASGNHLSGLTTDAIEMNKGSDNRLEDLNVSNVFLAQTTDTVLTRLRAGGIGLDRSDRNQISSSSVSKGSIDLGRSHHNLITGNSISGNPFWGRSAIGLSASGDNRIEHNEIFDNGSQGLTSYAYEGSGRNRIEHNSIHDNGGAGIQVLCVGDVVGHNTLARNYEGIRVSAERCAVENNVVSDGTFAMRVHGKAQRVVANKFIGNIFGVGLELCDTCVLEENVVADVTVSGGWAIGIGDSNESRVAGNLVSNIRGPGIAVGSGEGNVVAHNTIRDAETGLSLGATSTEVRANVVTGGATGMYIISADGNQIVANTLTGGSLTGIYLGFSERNRFARNRIAHYEGLGVHVIEAAHENRFERNTITRNGGGLAILPRPGMNFGGSHGNVLAGNWITRNGGDGIFAQHENTDMSLRGNHANRNADDGIDVEDPTASLSRNQANHNGDLGIEAVSGVTDGGRNKARRNGNPLQCLNVSC